MTLDMENNGEYEAYTSEVLEMQTFLSWWC